MGHEQAELVARVPAHVAGLAAAACRRLVDRPLHGHSRCRRGAARTPGGSAKARRRRRIVRTLPGCGGNASGAAAGTRARRSGRPCPCAPALSSASSASSDRIRPRLAGDGAPAASSAAAAAPREDRRGKEPRDAVAPLDVDPPRTQVVAAHPRILPGGTGRRMIGTTPVERLVRQSPLASRSRSSAGAAGFVRVTQAGDTKSARNRR